MTNIANRIRVSSPGIIAAIVLTVAAAGFLAATLLGAGQPIAEVAKPEPQQQTQQHSSEHRLGITPVLSHKTLR